MNLSVLERMVQEGDMSKDAIRYLLNCRGECERLDYKENLHLDQDKEICDFTKDVLGMKNVGGGYIVVGVQDKTWKAVGLSAPLPYDTKMLRDKIRRGSKVDLDVFIVHHDMQFGTIEGNFALILVRSSRKRNKRRTPTLIGHDFCAGKPFGLRRGEIYVRRGDSTVKIESGVELEDLLDGLESQADQDALVALGQSSPFAVEDGLYRLLEKGYERFIGRDKLRQDILSAVTRDPRIWIINVHGPGGVGKSALINWTINEFYHQRTFEAILQLTAKDTVLTPQGIMKYSRSLYSIENLLDHILGMFEEPIPPDLESKKTIAIELLSAWSTLLVLDNMETVGDGRILAFVQSLPPGTKAKVLITSRQKTGSWELPMPVNELNVDEVADFLRFRTAELGMEYTGDRSIAEKVWHASGGLPLAIQWILGQCKIMGNLESAICAVREKDSPVLEFSFGNIWKAVSDDAKAILSIMSIFEEPPTTQQLAIATEFQNDRIEKALAELSEVTLVTRNTQTSDDRTRYVALPITLSFARHQLETMGDFETKCRQRFQKFNEQMQLQESELYKFRSRFERFGIDTDNEKKAAILCQRGESEMFMGNVGNADMLFRQARELAPQSSYIYAMSASFELARNRVGAALSYSDEACNRTNKKTGSLCYTIKARVLDTQRDRSGRVKALAKAIEYDPEDILTRHQYGVALSRAGEPEKAIEQFSLIIQKEEQRNFPTPTMLMALKTRIINYNRIGRTEEAANDLERAKRLLSLYPHLQDQAYQFKEFDE